MVQAPDGDGRAQAGVLGAPILHSLSPALHRAGYAALGLTEWSYGRYELVAEQLAEFVAGLGSQWRGLSLTMPLKTACLEVADRVTPLARRAGAGNTLVRTDEGWLADNTDIPGLIAALRPAWQGWANAAVLGAGATARSSVMALEALGVSQVTVYARRLEQIKELIGWAATAVPTVKITASEMDAWTDGNEPVIVSTLPAGVVTGVGLKPRSGLLFDAVYAGWPTPLAQRGLTAGLEVIGGAELLIAQAALQFVAFTGQRAPELVLRAAAAAALSPKIVLTGFMGAGKSTVGAELAAALGMSFIDADQAIEARVQQSIPEIFDEAGEEGFRALEADVIADLLIGPPAVIALGGGAVTTPAVRQALAGHTVIFLDVEVAAARARIGEDPRRPLLASHDVEALFAARQGLYRQSAQMIVDANRPLEEVVAAVMAQVTS